MIETIGRPAMLEQLAEECSELAQAALKTARFLRGENPTDRTKMQCLQSLTEEMADVKVCMERLEGSDLCDSERIRRTMEQKKARAERRVQNEAGKSEMDPGE